MRNVIRLLKSENIINRLAKEITKGKILNPKEDPIQPIVDIIHGSIMKYDLETTRVGLKAVTDQVTKIIEPGREVEISSHFCHHLERVSRLAISKMDEESAIEVIESIGNFGLSTARKGLGVSTWYAVVSLGSVGGDAARKGLAHAAWEVAESLGIVGIATAEEGHVTRQAVRTLRYIGKVTAERGLGSVIVGAARSLVVVGTIAIKNGLEDVTRQAAEALAEVTILSEETVKDDIQNYEESILKEKDRESFKKFMKIYEQELEKLRAEK